MNKLTQVAYFAPLLPWQGKCWESLTTRSQQLPHGMLFSGMQGIGKRAFVWRFVAWMLCDNRQQHQHEACGRCQSCHWLATGTHPDLRVLPEISYPATSTEIDALNSPSTNKTSGKKTTVKATASSNLTSAAKKKAGSTANKEDKKNVSIRVDDIRALQPFISQGSLGVRICVIDHAESMTVAAANALLKTLEEPSAGVYLLLISDAPTKLLPTIKSRVQKVAIDQIERDKVYAYLEEKIKSNLLEENDSSISQETDSTKAGALDSQSNFDKATLTQQIRQLLNLANGAPIAALNILSSQWYPYREIWIKTWLALRTGKRSSIAASEYWQKNVDLSEFITLSEIMLMELYRYRVGLHTLQHDIDFTPYASIMTLNSESIQLAMNEIDDIKLAMNQNVQDKIAYDRILSILANL